MAAEVVGVTAVAQMGSLAPELPYATRTEKKKKKKKKSDLLNSQKMWNNLLKQTFEEYHFYILILTLAGHF